MKRSVPVIIAGVLGVAGMLFLLWPRAEHADQLYVRGNIITVDDALPRAEAVAVSGGRIVGVGSEGELRRKFRPDSTIDLQGKTLVPGFIDAHAHLEGIGVALLNLRLAGKQKEEILEEVRQASMAKGGGWIRGRGWDQNLWAGKAFPTARELDRVSGQLPVYLVRVDGHAVWVNSAVLSLAGVSRRTPDPSGGRVIRDPFGNPTGVFVDNAMDLLTGLLPPPSPAERKEALLLAMRYAHSKGITGIHDMGSDLERIGLLKELASKGELQLRVYSVLEGSDRGAVEEYLKRGPEIGLFDGRLTVRAIKLYADGALGSRGAALLAPYADDRGNRGLTLTDGPELEMATERGLEKGFQICIHAIGDRANNIVLSTFDKTFKRLNINGIEKRFRVEHAQLLDPADIPRFARLGVIPSMQPLHCTSDMPWAIDRVGRERILWAYAWRSLIDAGSFIPAGSDAPVEDPDVLSGIYAAVTRKRIDGTPEEGWNRKECMTREEGLRAFTIWGAMAAFQEGTLGSITPGKYADFVLLDDDPIRCDPRKIPRIRVERTVVGGRQVFPELGHQ